MRVDSHQHFWRVARGDYGWMDAGPGLAPLRRDFLPNDYLSFRQQHGIDRTILIQAAPTVGETQFLLDLAAATPWIAKVVGWINFEDPTHRRHLERFAAHEKFAGFRTMIQDIADPDWMLHADLAWAFEALTEMGLSFDALGLPRHAVNFRRILDRHPDLRVVLDHGLKPEIRNNGFDAWAEGIAEIARETPAFCKLSGLVTEADSGWDVATLRPYADHIIKSFGPARVMWGSDWPVVNLAGGFDAWFAAAQALVPTEMQSRIFGETAAEFYRLS